MLTATEAALLGLLRKGPMSGYDLRKDVFATQQRVVQTARPDKTIYELTDTGRGALREWVETAPLDAGQGRNLILLKLYLGEEADVDSLQRQLSERAEEAQRLQAELQELEAAGTGGSPFEAITRRWGLLYAEALLRWTEEAAASLTNARAAGGRRSR
jgi:DNA-binding PadR family transcriptional regulator